MRQRTRRFWFAGVGLALVLAVAGYAAAQGMGSGMRMPGMMGMMSQGGMGGMMGMMNMMQQCHRMMEGASMASATPITKERAEAAVKERLASLRNPNLKIGSVKEEETGFVAEIRTGDNSLVDKWIVDKRTGAVRSVY